ncbi:MAG: DUF4349 domain-containing protein, partial [Chloroflexi bacterium]|nr:DUF4349 domain-containing protein [Chloroflexota bacterium]
MKKNALYLLMLAALLLGACAPRATQTVEEQYLYTEPAIGIYAQPDAPAGLPPAAMPTSAPALERKAAYDSSVTGQDGAAGDRLVIKNGYLSVVVKDPLATLAAISMMAEAMGGYVVSSNVYQTTTGYGETAQKVNQASVTIRVPAAQLNAALDQIKAGATEVTSQNVSGQDVTQEYTDLQSR